MANIGTLMAHIGLDTAPLAAGATQAQGIFRGVSAAAVKMGGVLAAAGVAVGMGAMFKSIISSGAQFQQTLETVGGVMRATALEFDALKAKALEMGAATEWTATQAGEALQFMGMAGFNAADAIKALPGVLDLATAGQIGLGRSADIATNALTAMGLEVSSLGRVNDVFVGTITRSNTNMEMMAESFKYSAPIARAYKYSIEELSGMIGMLGNAGVQGSAAGTQLAMAMMKAKGIAKTYGYESSQLLDVLDSLKETFGDNVDYMQLFGMRAGRAALILKDATDETRRFQDTLKDTNGEAKILADRMRDTVAGSFKEFKSVIEAIGLESFAMFQDDLKDLVRNVTEFFRDHKELISVILGGIVKLLIKLFADVTRIATILATPFTVLSKLLGETETALSTATSGLGGLTTEAERHAESLERSAEAVTALVVQTREFYELTRRPAGLELQIPVTPPPVDPHVWFEEGKGWKFREKIAAAPEIPLIAEWERDLRAAALSAEILDDALVGLYENIYAAGGRIRPDLPPVVPVLPDPEEFDAGLDEMRTSWDSFADSVKASATNWGHSLSNVIADFVVSGKADFADFFKYLQHEFARLAAFEWAVKPLLSMMNIGVGTAAGGGIVGSLGVQQMVSPLAFAGAASFAGGGFVGGGVPVIAHKGEAILTPGQLAGIGKSDINIHYHGVEGGEVEVEQSPTGKGYEVYIWDAVQAGFARGKFDRVMSKNYGTYRRGVGR